MNQVFKIRRLESFVKSKIKLLQDCLKSNIVEVRIFFHSSHLIKKTFHISGKTTNTLRYGVSVLWY